MPNYGPQGGGGVASSTPDPTIFGDGSDGNVTISSGLIVLSRDMNYNNLTISGTGGLNSGNCVVRVKGTLDLSNAPNAAIYTNCAGSKTYLTQVASTGSTAPLVGSGGIIIGSMPLSVGVSSGIAGGTGAGANGAGPTLPSYSPFAFANLLGASGGAGSNAGGAAAAVQSLAANLPIQIAIYGYIASWYAFQYVNGGASKAGLFGGVSGAAGGGDSTNSGGAGGAGGNSGSWLVVFANNINRGASTAAGALYAKGQNGGAAGTPSTGNCGGGGGGAGGAGGIAWIMFNTLSGTTGTNIIDISGGNGGAGGNGVGTGNGGQGGPGGQTGVCMIRNLGAATFTLTVPATAGSAAGAASGITGGSGSAGASTQINL